MTVSIRRSYIDALDGQMHVTEAGTGQPIMLLPWFPRSALMYLDELEAIASRGYRAVALDLMGRGNSVTDNPGITIKRHADNIVQVAKSMRLEKSIILGGHYSSNIAAELAGRPALDAGAVVIDGGVLITDAVSDKILEKVMRIRPALLPSQDGSHRDYLWANAANIYDIYAPGYDVTTTTAHTVYRAIADFVAAYLQTGGASLALPPADNYPFGETLSKLKLPAVFLSAETEPLLSSLQPMEAIYSGPFKTHIFHGDHPLHFPDRKGEYANKLCDILDELAALK